MYIIISLVVTGYDACYKLMHLYYTEQFYFKYYEDSG